MKIAQLQKNTIIDQNGEIIEQVTSADFNVGKEPDYVKIYLEHIALLNEVPSWTNKVLYELLKSVSYANKGQLIIINSGYKRILAEILDMKVQSITNAINSLKKKNILIKKDTGVYLLNPQYFGKGDWKDISKIRYEVELGKNGFDIQLIETESNTEKEEKELEQAVV